MSKTKDSLKKIIANFEPVAIKYNGNSKDGYSVLVKDKKSDFSAWVDVWIEGRDVNTDWNQYIFHLTDPKDVKQKTLQEDNDIFDMATSEAIQYLQQKGKIHQGEEAKWYYGKSKHSSGGSMATGGGVKKEWNPTHPQVIEWLESNPQFPARYEEDGNPTEETYSSAIEEMKFLKKKGELKLSSGGSMATGGGVDVDEVISVKWKSVPNDYAKEHSELVIRYDLAGDTTLRLLEIKNMGYEDILNSSWVDTSHFNKFRDGKKYSKTEIRNEVVRLLKEGNLDSIKKEGLSSSGLKHLKKFSSGGSMATGGKVSDDTTLSDGKKLTSYLAVAIAEGFAEGESYKDPADTIKAWAYIQRHGMTSSLQGWFGRNAERMIEQGFFDRKGKIDWDVVDEAISEARDREEAQRIAEEEREEYVRTAKRYKFDELSDEAKEKAREWWINGNDSVLEWLTDDDYLFEPDHKEMEALFGKKYKVIPSSKYGDEPMIGNGRKNIYFSLGRGWYINAKDAIKINNDEMFLKWLGIPKKMMDKVYYSFVGRNDSTTSIEFEPNESDYEFTQEEEKIIEKAIEKFNNHMENVLRRMQKNYEWYFSDEQVDEAITANEYTFDKHGEFMQKGGKVSGGDGIYWLITG